MGEATCSKCGANIVWLKTKKGKNIPVEPETIPPGATIYDKSVMTCHFDVCPEARGKTAPKQEHRPEPVREPEPLPEVNLDADDPMAAPF